ncbi:MAG: zf-HC2 domain-containing protein, partial [Chloroflexota bacterium]|nr:zf-HC2 domain-containing protein [Chloroflexota bacterium]
LEGTLTLTERALFEEHLADCDDCPVYLDQIRKTISLAGALTEELMSPAAKEELLRRFHNWKNKRAQPPTPSL